MATNTENYGFRKVGLDAAADIEAIEKNWDLADAELKRIEDETMHKEDFDPDGDGVVDNAAKLGGQSPEYYASAQEQAVISGRVSTLEGKISISTVIPTQLNDGEIVFVVEA